MQTPCFNGHFVVQVQIALPLAAIKYTPKNAEKPMYFIKHTGLLVPLVPGLHVFHLIITHLLHKVVHHGCLIHNLPCSHMILLHFKSCFCILLLLWHHSGIAFYLCQTLPFNFFPKQHDKCPRWKPKERKCGSLMLFICLRVINIFTWKPALLFFSKEDPTHPLFVLQPSSICPGNR